MSININQLAVSFKQHRSQGQRNIMKVEEMREHGVQKACGPFEANVFSVTVKYHAAFIL